MELSNEYATTMVIFGYLDQVYNASTNQIRMEAYQKIDSFQQQLSSVDQLAALLSACQTEAQRNFGLHCLLCYLRNAWNRTRPEEKHQFKAMVFTLVAGPVWSMHDSLCKVIVELVKREWPQYWASFVPEMMELSKQNVSLVLSVFLRLSEDVFEFQNVPAQRRKDIMAGLNENVDVIFGVVYNCLVSNVEAYVAMAKQGCADPAAAGATLRLCKLALETLTAFMEWVKTDYLMQENALLIRMLVQLLPLPHVCYESAEAVLLFFEHKVKSLEPKAYLELVSGTNVLPAAASCLAQLGKLEAIGNFEDNFSQRLCQIVCCIGQHMATKVVANSSCALQSFDSVLELLVFLLNYPSKPIVFHALKLLLAVVRSEPAHSRTEPLLPKLLEGCRLAQLRHGLPSEPGHPSGAYSRVQFDSDEDYGQFFATLRSEACQALQAATQVWPVSVASHLLESLAAHTAALSGHLSASDASSLDARSPAVIQWDGFANHCEAVLARLPACLDSPGVDGAASERVRAGAKAATDALLNAVSAPGCLPQLRACLLTTLTAFLPFLASDRGLTLRAVQCVFNTLASESDPAGVQRTRAQREMRKHAVVCLLRLCKAWPESLLPVLAEYCQEVARLVCQTGGQLSAFESASLAESVVLLSNRLPDVGQRRATIESIMSSTLHLWVAPQLTQAVSNPALFLSAIGLDKPAVAPAAIGGNASLANSSVVNYQAGRIQIHHCLTTIYNAVRSCALPEVGQASPVAELATQAWPNLLRFVRCLQCLHTPEMHAQLHPDYARLFELDEVQKCQIMGIPFARKLEDGEGKSPLQKMRIFVTEAHAAGLRTIAYACKAVPSLADDWQLAEHLAVEAELQHLPDLLLADLLRSLSSVAVRDRPAGSDGSCQDLAGHLCRRLLGHSLARLNDRWAAVVANGGVRTGTVDEDGDADADLSDEVVSEQCLRRLGRAFLDLLHCLLLCGGSGSSSGGVLTAAVGAPDASATTPTIATAAAASVPLVERDPQLAAGALACLYDAIAWPDGPASQRAAVWAAPVTRQLALQLAASPSGGSDAPRHLLMQVLKALKQHGASGDAAVAGLIQLFVCLYDCFHTCEGFRRGLAEWTGQSPEKLIELDNRLGLRHGARPVAEKTRREIAKRFLEPFIGKPISEQFKLTPNYKNLPPLFKAAWKRKRADEEAARENLEGFATLFNDEEAAAS